MSSDAWLNQLAGKFIVFDGPDGSGKTTQFARFAKHCRDKGVAVCEVREPGGTSIGEQVREILLNPKNTEMSLRCEMMLYMASRAQLMEETIRPALERGEFVLADRFISSTLAYQGTAGGMEIDEILAVGRVAIGNHWPDLTVVFDVDEKTRTKRLAGGTTSCKRNALGPTLFSDRVESKNAAYHQRVRDGYLAQVENQPEKYVLIDGSKDENEVFKTLLALLAARVMGHE